MECITPHASVRVINSNMTSVIAKSVNNQVIPIGINSSLNNNIENIKRFSTSQNSDLHINPTEPLLRCSPTSSETSNFSQSSYDLYSLADYGKSKRKPIPVPIENKDDAYWERRRRNNESAKRSREIRRFKELQTTKRIVYLEQENVKLQAEIKFLREEVKRLRENEFLPYLVRTSIR